MIYIFSFLSGVVNGFFTTGAGQLLIFYLVFVKKYDSKISRGVTILSLSLVSTLTLVLYLKQTNIELHLLILILVISLISGYIGSKIMRKINSNILNLLSGVIIVILSLIQIIKEVI